MPPGMPRRFAPRIVAADEFVSMVQEAAMLIGAAPSRLCGLFLLVFVPLQLLGLVPYAAMPLRFSIGAVGLAGYFGILEAVRTGRPATLADMLAPWRLPADKIVLLAVSGLVPLLAVILVWWLDLGWPSVDSFLAGADAADALSMRQEFEFMLVGNLVGVPLTFLQPLCVLHDWSASRCLSANLLAVAANWRWALALAVISIPIGIGLDAVDQKNALEMLLSLLANIAVAMGLGAFTLVLLQRSLR